MKNLDHSLFHQVLDQYFSLPTLEVCDTEEELHSEGLLTSYLDFYQIFAWLKQNGIDSLTDMGAGLGRSLWVAKTWFPTLLVQGIELDPQRVAIAKKSGVDLIEASVEKYFISFEAQVTQSYYLYFPWGRHLFPWLKMIKQRPGTIVVVTESYGDFIKLLEAHAPWLKRVDQLRTYSVRHDPYMVFYKVEMTQPTLTQNTARTDSLESLAPLYLEEQDYALSFTYQSEKITLALSETELAYYPEKGFTLERLRPRRMYWGSQINDLQILPISHL